MLSVLVWTIFGALVGLLTSRLLRTDEADPNTGLNVVAGAAGAVIGGGFARLFGYGGNRLETILTFQGVLGAVAGAMLVLLAVNLFQARRVAPR